MARKRTKALRRQQLYNNCQLAKSNGAPPCIFDVQWHIMIACLPPTLLVLVRAHTSFYKIFCIPAFAHQYCQWRGIHLHNNYFFTPLRRYLKYFNCPSFCVGKPQRWICTFEWLYEHGALVGRMYEMHAAQRRAVWQVLRRHPHLIPRIVTLRLETQQQMTTTDQTNFILLLLKHLLKGVGQPLPVAVWHAIAHQYPETRSLIPCAMLLQDPALFTLVLHDFNHNFSMEFLSTCSPSHYHQVLLHDHAARLRHYKNNNHQNPSLQLCVRPWVQLWVRPWLHLWVRPVPEWRLWFWVMMVIVLAKPRSNRSKVVECFLLFLLQLSSLQLPPELQYGSAKIILFIYAVLLYWMLK